MNDAGAPSPLPATAAASAARRGRGLDALLRPGSVAVIGASERAGSVGAAVMRNLQGAGFAGPILPINPRHARVFGLPACGRVAELPAAPDLAVICTPAASVPGLVRECGAAGVGGLVILSAGFREAGRAGAELERALRAELERFPRLRVLGPNCLGLIVPARGLNASFARSEARPGGVAFLSQSGALCAAILGWARDEGVGFSHFVSMGNMLDVGFGDLLDELADDPQATSVVLYIEAILDAPKFLAAARRCAARKPVIACKAGRHPAAARAAASHTGAMAGEDAVYQAAFDECGVIRVNRLDDLLATAERLGRGPWPKGPRLGIVTNAGGPGVIAADALADGRGELARLAPSTLAALDSILPECWSHGNPVDVIGDAPPQRLAAALRSVAADEGVDATLVILTPQAVIDVAQAARAVAAAASETAKPVLASWMGGGFVREGIEILQAAGIPTFETPEQAIDAFLHLAAHARHVRALAEGRPRSGALPDHARLKREAGRLIADRCGTLGEAESKAVLAVYGIPVTPTEVAATRDAAVAAARRLGHPVVLKVRSDRITHKTDVDGVQLDLRSDAEVGAAFDRIVEGVRRHRPDAAVEGVTVQPMLDRTRGLELILGAKRDVTFGPVVLVGAGGITAEVSGDRAIGLAPFDARRGRELLQSLRLWPLLEDFRGRGPLHAEALADAMVRISHLLADLGTVGELEANPVLVRAEGVIALDARVVMAAPAAGRGGGGA